MSYSAPNVGGASYDEASLPEINLSAPAGSGGILLAEVYERAGGAIAPPASGWSQLGLVSGGRLGLWGRISDGSSDDDPTFSCATEGLLVGRVLRYLGSPATISGIAAATAATRFTSAAGIGTPAIGTPSEDNCLIHIVGAKEDDVGPTTGVPSGFSTNGDALIDGTSLDAWLTSCYSVQTTAASVGTGTITTSDSSIADARSIIVALKAGTGGAVITRTVTDTLQVYDESVASVIHPAAVTPPGIEARVKRYRVG